MPFFSIELPGPGILGEGKGNNQNCAIHFTRGHILQAIDCNQEGYIEESFKVASALSEFDCPRPPAILGFPEHVFSGLYALGDFAASAELAFGRLLQHTMASSLQSRFHYGHPDMFDKFAIVEQGGMSKAMKKLHVSEDIFAGMDAMLRGHHIRYVEYFQVGKGRDMGLVSVLSFFSKLSAGTAMMTSSRQAMRLGQRLGLAKLFGFYYAHIGYYAGQLHYYHAAYGLLALAFLGTLIELTGAAGTSPNIAVPCITVYNNLVGPFLLLVLLFSVVPLFFVTCEREGVVAAILKPLQQLLQLSPLFFILQSRCIGHYFSRTMSLSEAAYVATGRGLSVDHTDFHKLYAYFGNPCFYPGAELAAFLACVCSLAPRVPVHVNAFSVGFGSLMPVGLLLGPALLNPHTFSLIKAYKDLKRWVLWLLEEHFAIADDANADRSWSEFHQRRCSDKRSWSELESVRPIAPRNKYFLLPSKELLLAAPLVLVVWHTLRTVLPRNNGVDFILTVIYLADVVLPVVPFVLILVLVVIPYQRGNAIVQSCINTCCPSWKAEVRTNESSGVKVYIFFAAVILGSIVATEVLRAVEFSFDAPQVVALLACRYFCWRVSCNVMAYFAMKPDPPTVVTVSFHLADPGESTALSRDLDLDGENHACTDPENVASATVQALAAALKSEPKEEAEVDAILEYLETKHIPSQTLERARQNMLAKDSMVDKVRVLRRELGSAFSIPEYGEEAWKTFSGELRIEDNRGGNLVTIAPSNMQVREPNGRKIELFIVASDNATARQVEELVVERKHAARAKLVDRGVAVSEHVSTRLQLGIHQSLKVELAHGRLKAVQSKLKRSALFDLTPAADTRSGGLATFVFEPLRVTSAVTTTSVAFMVDVLLGLALQLVIFAAALLVTSLKAITCDNVDIDGVWYRWMMNEIGRKKPRVLPEEVNLRLRKTAQGREATERVHSVIRRMSVRELRARLDFARIDTASATDFDDLVKLAMQHYEHLNLENEYT